MVIVFRHNTICIGIKLGMLCEFTLVIDIMIKRLECEISLCSVEMQVSCELPIPIERRVE